MQSKILRLVSVAMLCLVFTTAKAQYAQFDMPGAIYTYLTAVNDSGDIAGWYSNGANSYGFVVMDGDTIELQYPSAQYTEVYGMNNTGLVVGAYFDVTISTSKGFVYDMGTGVYTDVTSAECAACTFASVRDVNDAGIFVGTWKGAAVREGFRGSVGGSYDIFRYTPSGSPYNTYVYAIDNTNKVYGFYIDGVNYTSFTATSTATATYDFFTYPSSVKMRFIGCNNQGFIVGDHSNNVSIKGEIVAVPHYTELSMAGLGAGGTSQAMDINEEGSIVGYFYDTSGDIHGFYEPIYDNGFRPSKDGWSFINSNTIDNQMWPSTWYDQFEYHVQDPYLNDGTPMRMREEVTDLGTHFTFPYDPSDTKTFPDWPLFVEVFGEVDCYTSAPVRQIRDRAFITWDHAAWKDSHPKGWKGSCFGMTASASFAYDDPSGFISSHGDLFPLPTDLYTYFLNDATRYVVNYYQTLVHSKDYRQTIPDSLTHHINVTMNSLKASILANDHNQVLAITDQSDINRVHAIFPYKIEKVPGSGGEIEKVYVYDPNNPGDDNRYMTIYNGVGTGSWSYFTAPTAGSSTDYGGSSPFYTVTTMNSGMYDGVYELPYARTSSPTILMTSDINQLRIIPASSAEMGSLNGNVYYDRETAGGNFPLIPITDQHESPWAWYLNSDDYSFVMDGDGDSIYELTVMDDNIIYQYQRFLSTLTEIDHLKLTDGLGVSNRDASDKVATMKTIMEMGSSEMSILLEKVDLTAGDSIYCEGQTSSEELNFQNHGGVALYDVTVKIIGNDGTAVFQHTDVPINGNAMHTIKPDVSDIANSDLLIIVDEGMDGVPDDTLYVVNQKMPEMGLSAYTVLEPATPGRDTIYIENIGGGEMDWSVDAVPSWVTVTTGNTGGDEGMVIFDYAENTGGFRTGIMSINSTTASNAPIDVEINQESPTAVPYVLDLAEVKVFPNPTADKLFVVIQPTEPMNLKLELFDLQGRLVAERMLWNVQGRQQEQMDVSQLPSGQYMLNITDGPSTQTVSIIVE